MLKEAHRQMRKDGLWMKKQDRPLCAASPIPKHHHFPWSFWTKTECTFLAGEAHQSAVQGDRQLCTTAATNRIPEVDSKVFGPKTSFHYILYEHSLTWPE